MSDPKLTCIGCRHLHLHADYTETGQGSCDLTGDIMEMPMLACSHYKRPGPKHIPIPDWYREILTATQANYMQEIFDGRSIRSIADIYGRTEQSVSMTLRRAKARIKGYRQTIYHDTDSVSMGEEVKS